jgi:hypothetical protein
MSTETLTPKQFRRHVAKMMQRKLHACQGIAHWIFPLGVNQSQAAENRALVPDSAVFCAILVVSNPMLKPLRRATAALLLDLVSVDWRSVAGPEILGGLLERDSPEVRNWRAAVLERDQFECQECGSTDNLHAHHINRWIDAPELRIDIDNGLTLCQPCHQAVHATRLN